MNSSIRTRSRSGLTAPESEDTRSDFLSVLNEVRFLWRNSPHEALSKIADIMPRLRRVDDPNLLCKALIFQCRAFNLLGMQHELKAIIAELFTLENRIHDVTERCNYLMFISACYTSPSMIEQNLTKAYDYIIQAYACAKAGNSDLQRVGVLIDKGTMHYTVKEYDLALECYLHAHDAARNLQSHLSMEQQAGTSDPVNFHELMYFLLTNIGAIYILVDEHVTAYRYYRSALPHAKKSGAAAFIARCYCDIGYTITAQHAFGRALASFTHALTLADKMDARPLRIRVLSGIAQCYHMMNKPDQAAHHIDQALHLCRTAKGMRKKMPFGLTFQIAGEIMYASGDFTKAEHAYRKAERFFGQSSFLENCRLSTYNSLIKLYAKTGEADKLARYERKYYRLREEMMTLERQRNIARIEQREEMRKVEEEYALVQSKLRETESRAEELSREVSEVRTRLIRQRESLCKLQGFLRKHLEDADGPVRRAASQLMKAIDLPGPDPDDLSAFEFEFEQSSRAFSNTLLKHCPRLTPTELRLCNYIRLGLPIKQIAELMYVTVDTVKTHRKNARRKLGLKTSDNLTSFLIGIG